MPCDQVRTTDVKWSKDTDVELLAAAMRDAGLRVNVSASGVLSFNRGNYQMSGTYNPNTCVMSTCDSSGDLEGQLRRGYSKQVVDSQAKRFGWKIEWQTNPKTGNMEATAKRRL